MRRLTVLGSGGAWPEPGGAASGFLIDYDGFRIVLDLGYGTCSRLLQVAAPDSIAAVVVTHEHPDHFVDVSALYRARRYGHVTARIPLLTTAGVVDRLEMLEGSPLDDVFDSTVLPGSIQVGPFELRATLLPHHVPNVGVRLVGPDLILAYTGDTGPDDGLLELGDRADLFIVEATLQGPPPHEPGRRMLMTAGEAGAWARRAGAKRLLLTHFWPGSNRQRSVAEAAATFHGNVLAATDGMIIELS